MKEGNTQLAIGNSSEENTWKQLVEGDKADFVHFQMHMIKAVEFPQSQVKCRCGHKAPVYAMYRCYYCGEFYCEKCAPIHYGKTREEYKKEQNKEA